MVQRKELHLKLLVRYFSGRDCRVVFIFLIVVALNIRHAQWNVTSFLPISRIFAMFTIYDGMHIELAKQCIFNMIYLLSTMFLFC